MKRSENKLLNIITTSELLNFSAVFFGTNDFVKHDPYVGK